MGYVHTCSACACVHMCVVACLCMCGFTCGKIYIIVSVAGSIPGLRTFQKVQSALGYLLRYIHVPPRVCVISMLFS